MDNVCYTCVWLQSLFFCRCCCCFFSNVKLQLRAKLRSTNTIKLHLALYGMRFTVKRKLVIIIQAFRVFAVFFKIRAHRITWNFVFYDRLPSQTKHNANASMKFFFRRMLCVYFCIFTLVLTNNCVIVIILFSLPFLCVASSKQRVVCHWFASLFVNCDFFFPSFVSFVCLLAHIR